MPAMPTHQRCQPDSRRLEERTGYSYLDHNRVSRNLCIVRDDRADYFLTSGLAEPRSLPSRWRTTNPAYSSVDRPIACHALVQKS